MSAGKCVLAEAHGPETPQPVPQLLTRATVPAAASVLILGLAMNKVDPKHKVTAFGHGRALTDYSGS